MKFNSLKNLIIKRFWNTSVEQYNSKNRIEIIQDNMFSVDGSIDLHSLEKIIKIDFSYQKDITLVEFLREKIKKNLSTNNTIEFRNCIFTAKDENFSKIIIKKKQQLNGKPLFYM